MVSAASEIPIFFLLSKYGDKMKESPLLTFASLMFALRFLLMALAADPLSVLAVQSLHSITFGVFYVTAVRYITRIIPWQYRATGMALFIIFWSSVSGLLSGPSAVCCSKRREDRPSTSSRPPGLYRRSRFSLQAPFAKPEDMNVGGISA